MMHVAEITQAFANDHLNKESSSAKSESCPFFLSSLEGFFFVGGFDADALTAFGALLVF
jgi:hypothetical protein